ncbi:MAG: ABC transporter permease, partial [Phycisphaerae bacterium]|nr:ABC transporter permease [Phycisphaerae bacterium]
VGIVLIGAMLLVLPFVTQGDGVTLTSRVQSFLAYALGSTGFILSVVTVFLSCMAISEEIVNKRIFMIATKPLPRWQFVVGKWLGISVLNAALLLVCLVAILIATWLLQKLPTNVAGDRGRLENEVLSARHGVPPITPDFRANVEQAMRQMREQGQFENATRADQSMAEQQLAENLSKSWRSLPPRRPMQFEFRNLLVDRKAKGFLQIHMKPTHPGGLSDISLPLIIQCGDPAEPETLTNQLADSYAVGLFHSIPVPYSAVNSKGVLYVMMANMDPRYTFTFEGKETLELMYDVGTFHWNVFRALSIIWCRLGFLAAVGLMMSSFLSFPVASMGTFLILIAASSAGFLAEALDWVAPEGYAEYRDTMGPIGPILRSIVQSFMWIVPDFSKNDPDDNIVNGRLVTLMWLILAFAELIVIKASIVLGAGCLIFSRRELAGET